MHTTRLQTVWILSFALAGACNPGAGEAESADSGNDDGYCEEPEFFETPREFAPCGCDHFSPWDDYCNGAEGFSCLWHQANGYRVGGLCTSECLEQACPDSFNGFPVECVAGRYLCIIPCDNGCPDGMSCGDVNGEQDVGCLYDFSKDSG